MAFQNDDMSVFGVLFFRYTCWFFNRFFIIILSYWFSCCKVCS